MSNIEWFELKYEFRRWWQKTFVHKSYWWLMYRLVKKHKYHLIDTGMKPGYNEISVRIEAALAKLVIDFVEEERFPEVSNRDECISAFDTHIQLWKNESCHFSQSYIDETVQKEIEFKELYLWCKEWYSTLTYEEDIFYDEQSNTYQHENRKLFDQEVDKRMKQIIEFRNFMWT